MNNNQDFVNQVVQQLSQVEDLEITDTRINQEGFGKYLFARYKKNNCMIQMINIENKDSFVQKKQLFHAKENVKRLQSCPHKNILAYYDSFQIDQNFFIIMEQPECSLQEWINKNKKNIIGKEQFLKFALEMVETADYLHQKKYVLSNVTLKNIFLDEDLNIKFSTFTIQQEVKVDQLMNENIFQSLENNELVYIPLNIVAESDNQNIVILSSKVDVYIIGLCLYSLTGVSFFQVLDFIQKGSFQLNLNLGVEINQYLRLMLLRSNYQSIPSPAYFVKSFQSIKDKQQQNNQSILRWGEDDVEIIGILKDKIQQFKYLKLLDDIIHQIDFQKISCLTEEQEAVEKIDDEDKEDGPEETSKILEKSLQLEKLYPQSDIPYLLQGDLYYRIDDIEKSIESNLKAVEINSKNDIAHYQLGLLYSELGQDEDSLHHYDLYVNLNPFDDEVYSNIGSIYLEQDFDKSKQYLMKSIGLNPRQSIAYYNLGSLYLKNQNYQKAIAYYKKANSLQQDNDTTQSIGFTYNLIKNYENSKKFYKKLLMENPEVEDYLISQEVNKSLI